MTASQHILILSLLIERREKNLVDCLLNALACCRSLFTRRDPPWGTLSLDILSFGYKAHDIFSAIYNMYPSEVPRSLDTLEYNF